MEADLVTEALIAISHFRFWVIPDPSCAEVATS